jgi:penicillin amidase
MEASASNSWVISGNLTKSGKPILANDPHLEVTIPSEWYQFAMEYVSTNGKVRTYKGAAITGGLNSLIGRTHYIAWGCTNVYTDTIDLYKEQLDETKTHYLFDGVMRKLKIRNEIIKVKGQPDVEFELKFTHRGPLLPYVNFWTHVY